MVKSTDIVIIGAGIVGSTIGYQLATLGMEVRIIDQGGVGSGASGVAAGLLLPISENPIGSPLTTLGTRSLALHRKLTAELLERTGIDVGLANTPVLLPAFTEKDANLYLDYSHQPNSDQHPIEWLDANTARSFEPLLSSQILGCLLSESEGQINPQPLLMALSTAAERHGASYTKTEVTNIGRTNNHLISVESRNETYICQTIVLAMGPWTASASQWVDMDIPVRPVKGELLWLNSRSKKLNSILFHQGDYLAPKAGYVVAGATMEEAGFDTTSTLRARESILEKTEKLAPALNAPPVTMALAGLRPVSKDSLPIIGPIPDWPEVLIATGHGRNGILLAPITAQFIIDHILGSTLTDSHKQLLPGRFG